MTSRSAIVPTIVRCTDAKILAELHRLSFDRPWRNDEFEKLLAMPGMTALVATVKGVPVGCVLFCHSGLETEIVTLLVVPSHRRRAIAGKLLESARETVASAGGQVLNLEVAEDNHGARRLYAKHGIAIVGRRQNYFKRSGGESVDAILMSAPCG